MRPTPRPHLWVVGAGGLLGSSVVRAAGAERCHLTVFRSPPIHWATPQAATDLSAAARRFRQEVGDGPWAVAWCAGAGIIGTDREQLTAETHMLERLLPLLPDAAAGTVFLSSSAGGVYGGSVAQPITEATPTVAISDYGSNKLRQEALVGAWAREAGGRAVIGRISNLYGPGQSLQKPQGLISHVARAAIDRQPVGIFVSLDTIRDYLFADDAASQVIDLIGFAGELEPGDTHVKIVASMRSISIGGILAEVRRVVGRNPSVVMARSPHASAQGSVLNFRSTVPPRLDRHNRTTLPAGIDSVAADLRRRAASGHLHSLAPG